MPATAPPAMGPESSWCDGLVVGGVVGIGVLPGAGGGVGFGGEGGPAVVVGVVVVVVVVVVTAHDELQSSNV